ncbi:hypothetical protein [Sphingomonas sp.]|uniref:hypothetical protein n=1 Tax=Sphingomonas sp. TaxID=28214 RepID=UPI003CC57868
MPPDHALQAEALAIIRDHGDDAARWVAERTIALNLVGHREGVHRYRRIAALIEEMRGGAAASEADEPMRA